MDPVLTFHIFGASPFSFSGAEVASWQGLGKVRSVSFTLPGREASPQSLVCFLMTTCNKDGGRVWLLASCVPRVRVYWGPRRDFRRKGCLSVQRKWCQTSKLLPGPPPPQVSPLCGVTNQQLILLSPCH